MKRLLVFVFQFLNNSFSQKIIKSEIDQFTNEKKTKSNMLILGRGMNSSLVKTYISPLSFLVYLIS